MKPRPLPLPRFDHPVDPLWIRFAGTLGFLLFSLLLLTWFTGSVTSWILGYGSSIAAMLRWTGVGLALAILASLLAWPLALISISVIEQTPSERLRRALEKTFLYFSTLPLFLFAMAYLRLSSGALPSWLENFWRDLFASSNALTQSVSFAITLVSYPFSVLPRVADGLTVDDFYRRTLSFVLEFGQASLLVISVLLALVFFVLPQMVVAMLDELRRRDSHRIFEAVQAMGGSRWQATQMAVLQTMGARFWPLMIRFVRICFFEGVITFFVLRAFSQSAQNGSSEWLWNLSVSFLNRGLESQTERGDVLVLSFILGVQFLGLLWFEGRLGRKGLTLHV